VEVHSLCDDDYRGKKDYVQNHGARLSSVQNDDDAAKSDKVVSEKVSL
jgi:hypothetical protein